MDGQRNGFGRPALDPFLFAGRDLVEAQPGHAVEVALGMAAANLPKSAPRRRWIVGQMKMPIGQAMKSHGDL
jgi:hypothetical protein